MDLRERLEYDPATGIFRWKPKTGILSRTDKSWNTRFAGTIAGSLDSYGYRQVKISGRMYLAHRLAWLYVYGQWPDGELDHWDGGRDNNAIGNLRPASRHQNMQNSTVNRSTPTGIKGVYKRCGRYRAQIKINAKVVHLGTFDTSELAFAAYKEAATKHFGEFARVT